MHVIDYGIYESTLSKFHLSIVVLCNSYPNIVHRVTLIFNVKACFSNLTNDVSKPLVIRTQEDSIIHVHDKNDVITEKYALIYQ